MTIQPEPGHLRWRVHLSAPAEAVYRLIATDDGRQRFWAERSQQNADQITLTFPDGSQTVLDVISQEPPSTWVVRYFGALTSFEVQATSVDTAVLEVRASDVPDGDCVELAAGWVSVLMNLKAVVNAGTDLRNHHRDRTWQTGFVDN